MPNGHPWMTEMAVIGPHIGSLVQTVGVGGTAALAVGVARRRRPARPATEPNSGRVRLRRRVAVAAATLTLTSLAAATPALAYPPDPCLGARACAVTTGGQR